MTLERLEEPPLGWSPSAEEVQWGRSSESQLCVEHIVILLVAVTKYTAVDMREKVCAGSQIKSVAHRGAEACREEPKGHGWVVPTVKEHRMKRKWLQTIRPPDYPH